MGLAGFAIGGWNLGIVGAVSASDEYGTIPLVSKW